VTARKSVTIRDVARHAGVGVGTVSRVINQSDAVSSETRQKVLVAINELDYTPSSTARRLSLGKTMTIGVILPFFTNPSYVERLRGIESMLADSDYDLILFNAETPQRRDASFQNVLQREQVDGLLIITHIPSDGDVARFLRSRLPVVLIDARHSQLSHVIIDDVQAAYEATHYLIELGHHKIGFISDYLETSLNFMPIRDRHLGYYQALEEVGIPYRPEYHRQGPHGRSQARQMAHELLALPDPPTAIFAYSDTQAIGVLEAAQEREIRVPQDLSVIGFDDVETAAYWKLTTVRQPLFDSGVKGGEILFQEMKQMPAEPREIILPTELIIRATTASPNEESHRTD
jgi:DNA-binding LacI/PurR family transcriptional regulator